MPKRTIKAKGSGKARAGNLPQAKQDNVASQQSTETVDKQEFSEEQDSSDEQENCDVCCDVCCTPIVDGRDDALQCEGVCQKWLHRLCAGVSKSHHNALSNSSQCLQVYGFVRIFTEFDLAIRVYGMYHGSTEIKHAMPHEER